MVTRAVAYGLLVPYRHFLYICLDRYVVTLLSRYVNNTNVFLTRYLPGIKAEITS